MFRITLCACLFLKKQSKPIKDGKVRALTKGRGGDVRSSMTCVSESFADRTLFKRNVARQKVYIIKKGLQERLKHADHFKPTGTEISYGALSKIIIR